MDDREKTTCEKDTRRLFPALTPYSHRDMEDWEKTTIWFPLNSPCLVVNKSLRGFEDADAPQQQVGCPGEGREEHEPRPQGDA